LPRFLSKTRVVVCIFLFFPIQHGVASLLILSLRDFLSPLPFFGQPPSPPLEDDWFPATPRSHRRVSRSPSLKRHSLPIPHPPIFSAPMRRFDTHSLRFFSKRGFKLVATVARMIPVPWMGFVFPLAFVVRERSLEMVFPRNLHKISNLRLSVCPQSGGRRFDIIEVLFPFFV